MHEMTVVLCIEDGIAVLVPHLDLMVSLVGAVSSSMLAYVVPAVMELVHTWPNRAAIPQYGLRVVAKQAGFLLIGFGSMVGGTIATIIQIIDVSSEPAGAP